MKSSVLTLIILSFVVAGCSQPAQVPVQGPAQEPLELQFGTAGNDSVEQLAVDESGVYLGGQRNGKPALVKFSRTGRIPWTKGLGGPVVEVALDSDNNAYVVYYSSANNARYFIRKYTSSGTLVWKREITNPSGVNFDYHASDTDAQNNVYLAFSSYGNPKTELRKYSSDGKLMYDKQISGFIRDLAVTPGGTTYTVSEQHLTRYTSQGQQVWRKTVPFAATQVAVGGSSQVHVGGYDPSFYEERQLLAKYSSRGAKVWQRTVREDFFSSLRALDADTEGNVFVGVEYHEDPYSDVEVYFYSYNAAGTRLAKRVLDFGGGSNLLSEIAALSTTEVYLGGTVVTNLPDNELDGFLTRLNGLTGSVTWQR